MAVQVPKLNPNGMTKAALYEFLNAFAQKFQDVLEKLDADGGVTDTDYESVHGFAAGDINTATTTEGRGVIL